MWREIFKWPLDERMERLRDPALRQQMADDAATVPPDSMIAFVADIEQLRRHLGRPPTRTRNTRAGWSAEIAAEEGREPIDVMLDLALDDDLMTIFAPTSAAATTPKTSRCAASCGATTAR